MGPHKVHWEKHHLKRCHQEIDIHTHRMHNYTLTHLRPARVNCFIDSTEWSLREGRNGPGRDKAPSFRPSHPTEQYKKHPIKVATCFDRAENVSQRGLRRRQHHGRLVAYSASAPSLTFTINTQQTTLYPLQIKPLRHKTATAVHSTRKVTFITEMSKWALPPTAGLFKSVRIWVKVLRLSEEQSTESQLVKNVLWEWL